MIHTKIPTGEPLDIHDIFDAEEAALDARREQRQAKLNAMAAECDRAWEAAAPQREREAARKEAKRDAEFAALSKQFLKMMGDA